MSSDIQVLNIERAAQNTSVSLYKFGWYQKIVILAKLFAPTIVSIRDSYILPKNLGRKKYKGCLVVFYKCLDNLIKNWRRAR